MTSSKEELLELIGELVPGFRRVRFYLLLFFTLTMPLVIYLGNTEYGYTKTIYTFVYISFLVLVWLAELLVNEDAGVALTRLSLPAGLLLVSGLLSLINAPSKGVVLQSLALLVYFYLIYLLVANTVRTEAEVKYLLIALVTSAVGATIYGTLQFYGVVRGAHGFSAGAGNIISVMGNQNYLGGFVAYLFVPAFALIFTGRSRILKAYLTLSLGLFFFLLFPIGSRGSWLAIALGVLFFGFILIFYRPLSGFETKKILVTLLVILAVLLAVYVIAPTPNPLRFNLDTPSADQLAKPGKIFMGFIGRLEQELVEEGGARIEDWNIGLEMLKDHPVTGIGLGNYKIKFLEYRAKLLNSDAGEGFGGHIPRGAQAHNEYVQFAAELGLIGVVTILFSLVFLLGNAFRRATLQDSGSTRLLGFALIAGLLGFLVHSTVSFPAHLPASSFAFVSFLGLLNSRAFGEVDYELDPSGGLRYAAFGLLALLLIGVSVFAFRDWRANVLRGKGKRQLDFGNFHLARENFRQSLDLDFQPRQTYYYLGLVERRLGNDEKAIKYFEKSLGQFEPYTLYLQLGVLYREAGDLEKAESYLRDLIAMDPESDHRREATYQLALIASQRGDFEEASGHLEWILNRDSDFEKALVLQGDIADHRGNEEAAREKFNRALEVIEEKASRVERRLSGEVQMENYAQLKSEREELSRRKKVVEQKLEEL